MGRDGGERHSHPEGPKLESFMEGRELVKTTSEGRNPGGSVAWDDHASPVQHGMQSFNDSGAIGWDADDHADVHYYDANQDIVVPGAYVNAPSETATLGNAAWNTAQGAMSRARIDRNASLRFKIRTHGLDFGSMRVAAPFVNRVKKEYRRSHGFNLTDAVPVGRRDDEVVRP